MFSSIVLDEKPDLEDDEDEEQKYNSQLQAEIDSINASLGRIEALTSK